MRTAIVTGGAGFLGSHLCETLIDRGYYVICLDNLETGRTSNVAHLVGHDRFEVMEADVLSPRALSAVANELAGRNPYPAADVVFHLACAVSPAYCDSRPLETIDVVIDGTRNVLDLAERLGARFLLASSSEIYGDAQVVPTPETYTGNLNTVSARAPYAEGKRVAETLTCVYRQLGRVDACIARIFNVYGPRMRPGDGRVVPAFFEAAMSDEPLVLFGDGSQTRSLCYVTDTAAGLVALAESGFPGPVNIGNDTEMSMRELALTVRRVCSSRPAIEYRDGGGSYAEEPHRRCPDTTLARTLLRWQPTVTLEEGLSLVHDHYLQRRHAQMHGCSGGCGLPEHECKRGEREAAGG